MHGPVDKSLEIRRSRYPSVERLALVIEIAFRQPFGCQTLAVTVNGIPALGVAGSMDTLVLSVCPIAQIGRKRRMNIRTNVFMTLRF